MPKLSVIVTFDVTEPHLQNCLDSLTSQRWEDADGSQQEEDAPGVEVVLAPVRGGAARPAKDGEDHEEGGESVDTAREAGLAAARGFAQGPHPGLRAIVAGQDSPGHAQARALGAGLSQGEYLLFLAGEDALTGFALPYLLGELRASGSDLAVADVYRFNELGARPSKRHRKVCAQPGTGVDPRSRPVLLGDRILGNKLWRRTFWESLPDPGLDPADADLGVARALLHTHRVDVLTAPVLLWRDRDEPQLPLEAAALTRRVRALARVSAALEGPDRDLWDQAALQGEVYTLLLRLDDAEPPLRDTVLELVNDYLDRVPAHLLAQNGAMHRLLYHLVRKHRTADLLEAVTFAKSVELKKAPVVRRGLHYYVRYPFFEESRAPVPREVYRLGADLRVRQKTEEVRWEEGRLLISGRAGIRHLRAGRRWQQQMVAFAVDTESGRRVRLPVRVRRAAEYRLPDVPDAARHDYGGFTVVVDPRKLRVSGRWRAARWKVELVVVNRGLTRRRFIANPVAGPPERPSYRCVADEVWVRPHWDAERHLVVDVAPERARADGHRLEPGGAELELTGEVVSDPAAQARRLRLVREPGTACLEYPVEIVGARFCSRVRVADLLSRAVVECGGVIRQEEWTAHLVTEDGRSARITLPEEAGVRAYGTGDGHELAVQRTATGHLRLRAGRARPTVEDARWNGRVLELEGAFSAGAGLELVAKARGRDEEHRIAVERDGERFRAVFAPAEVPTLSGDLPLPAGGYQVWARVRTAGEASGAGSTDVGVEFADGLIERLPLTMQTTEREYTLSYVGQGVPLLQVGSDLRPAERGAFAQRRLREDEYPRLRQEPVREGILFDSYTGRQYSDSPQSIYAELRSRGGAWAEYPMSWLVADGQVRPPGDLSAVRYRGAEFYEALARSRYIVTNSRQPAWFARRPEQVVVQTWHGSMLKRIGFDIENIRGKSRDYHDKLAWETRQWDYLVSPSPWATPILRRAFRFDGEILETGYPRNDIFFAPDREQVAARVRRRLGLPEGKKVVLYAPTWRDDKYYTRGRHKLDLHLDLRRMYDKLGHDHVLLVRRHPRVVDSVPIVGEGFVHDVSLYPEIMELFLITDVLVTDYSSMMFDFANTGRPMLFFTYDLDSYRDNLRGFYFDFEQTAPGPLLTESDQVIGALLDIEAVAEEHRPAYRAFTEQFCPLDDGNAAARVVDRVFGGGS